MDLHLSKEQEMLRKMVRGGNLGCKTGKGFYVYNADRTKTPVDAL